MRLRSWRQTFRDVELDPWSRKNAQKNASRKRLLCSSRGCHNQGRWFIHTRWGRRRFCTHHHRLQLEHERILDRIRSL
jgi:hypothetical protein